MRWEDEKTDKYALSQMKKIIAFVEENTGEKFDPDAFLAMMERHNAEVAAEQEQWDFMMTPYTPFGLSICNLFHTVMYAFSGGHLTGGWQHLVEFWDWAEKFNCDMVLMNEDITCKGALGLTGVVNDQAKDHPNVHVMVVPNDLFDYRTFTRNDIRQVVNQYMTSVMQEEPLDATLLDFDDNEGW